jgi:hypothetical protein
MKSRDVIATSAIRSVLGAIDNAGSVNVSARDAPEGSVGSGYTAGSVQGLGAGDVPRSELDDRQITEIVRAEVTDREVLAEEYRGLDRTEEQLGSTQNARSCAACSGAKLPTSHRSNDGGTRPIH